MVFLFYRYLLVPLLPTSHNSLRSTPASDLTFPTSNIIGRCRWVCARGTARQLCFLHRSTLNYTGGGGIEVDCCILPYNAKVDLKTIQKTIRLRLVRTQTYWKELNSRDNDDSDAIPLQKRAEEKVTLTRRRTRGTHVRKD